MQVDVHGVDAEIARPRLADDGVEVGAVAVEIRARLMQRRGDLDDLALEQAAGVGVGQHDRGDVGAERRAHRRGRRRSRRRGREWRARKSRSARRSRDWCRARNPAPARPCAVSPSPRAAIAALIAIMPQSSPCAPAFGVIATAFMPVIVISSPASDADQRQRALHGRDRLQRMRVGEAGQPRHLLVEPRVVLHRAGAERIEPGVDRIVLARQPHVMAQRLRLAEARQADRRARARAAPRRSANGGGASMSTPVVSRAADLEQQRLLDVEAAIAGEGFAPRRRSPAAGRVGRPWLFMTSLFAHQGRGERVAKAARSSSVLVSVEATIKQIVEPGARREPRDRAAGDDAARRQRLNHRRRRLRQPDREFVEEMRVEHLDAGHARKPLGEIDGVGVVDARRAGAGPASPSSVRWMVKASAHSPELVQMLLVAFSRRMCCSRVDSVSTKPRRPSASTVSPASRPGICRTYLLRVANRPT